MYECTTTQRMSRQLERRPFHSENHFCSTQTEVPLILCIDDEPEVSRSIEMRLRDYLVDVSRAYFGMQGFWEAVTDRPDLILMDLAMPNGDGRFLLESLRRNSTTATIPVIVLTGMRDAHFRNELFALGANQFLQKPIAFDDLFHEMSRFVDLQKRPDA
ncbi:MAG: response regulator [Pirellulaceae bacterium]|nr:response regulator transcription factor [Planctomycetales bacterium]